MSELRDSNLDTILSIYRRELEVQPDFALEILVHHYGIVCSDDRQDLIDDLVEHFKRELEDAGNQLLKEHDEAIERFAQKMLKEAKEDGEQSI